MASIALTSPAVAASRAGNRLRFTFVGLGTVVAAVAANLLVYAVGRPLVGYDPGFVVLANASGTALFTVVPALVAVALYAALLRFARRPARTFTVISAIVLVVSLVPDITYIPTVPGASSGQTAILMLMHIVAAAVIAGLLTGYTRPRAR